LRGSQADPRAGSTRDEKKPAVDYAKRGNKHADLQDFTGATGLETATSGVTGRFEGHHGSRRWTRNRSIHAASPAFS
ncbi:MAG: hypothetical protein M3295_08625, partial [Chloroflexota bacterium]|nr:hypothetical protein [Chloroflexota bacterium]